MKWTYYPLQANDKRATELIAINLGLDRTLVRKLRERFPLGTGELFAISMEDLDLDSLQDFHYATYRSGKQWDEAAGTSNIPIGDRDIDGLISFLKEFLRCSNQGIVVVTNWIAKRTKPDMSAKSRAKYLHTSRLAFYGDEVHHVLSPEDSDHELFEDTIREPWHQWFAGVCASGLKIPDDNEFSADFLDELVARTEHIFVPAFDSEGFLVWSPRQSP